jgi:DNA polymerase-4
VRPRALLGGDGPETRQWVLHVDLDQFLAAVEVLRRPELAGLPVVVGGDGDPTKRGVVSTASYEARALGVGSGMPLRTAARKAPDAVFLPVDRPAYDAVSAQVMDTLRAQRWAGRPVLVQVLGWDEAFLAADTSADTSADQPVEGEDLGEPEVVAAQVRAAVLEATSLHCSVGIGDNRLRAKIATDLGKPRGTFRLTAETWTEVMGGRPTSALWGIGTKTARRLAALGIETVTQLGEADPAALAAELGPTTGPWLHRLGLGVDTSPVDPTPWVARAHGRETTFQADLDDHDAIVAEVRRLTREVLADLEVEGRPATRVGLKVRLRPFTTVQRSLTLGAPTTDPAVLEAAAVSLLDRVEQVGQGRPVRLLGVRLEMAPPA